MSDPFFSYFERERETASRNLYGPESRAKEYPRFPKVSLPEPLQIDVPLSTLLSARRSTRDFSGESISTQALSSLLHWSFGSLGDRADTPHALQRPHPSGGARYPLECYPIVLSVDGIASGVYHYNVVHHQLELLPSPLDVTGLVRSFRYDFIAEASVVLCYTYVKSRQIKRYGGFAYKVGLIEAGNVGQNVYLTTGALELGCCALGGGDHEPVQRMLGIDGGNEHLVYGIAVGKR